MINLYLNFVDRCSKWCAALAALSLLGMTVLMLSEVVARNVFVQSLTFTWEFSGYLMGAAFFLGAAHTLRTGGHVRVTILAEHLSPAGARILDILATLVGLAVSAFIFYALCDLLLSSYQREVLSFTPTQTPLIYPQGLLVIGSLMLLLQMLARFIRLLRNEPPDHEPENLILGSGE